MTASFDYDTHVARNKGYVSDQAQQRLRQTRLLVAGCGIGSSVAICATRLGFENFILVDGDTVSAHNLNRQFFGFADIDRPKVEALADAIHAINPLARVTARNEFLHSGNTAEIVAASDLIFDTVDFLDLRAIEDLHNTARRLGKPIFTALSVGFGALVWYFPPDSAATLPQMLAPHMPPGGRASGPSEYAEVFGRFIGRLAPFLDRDVVEQIDHVLGQMRDNKPCPASQVAVGSFSVAAMAMTMIVDHLSGTPLPASPKLVLHSFRAQRTQIVDLGLPA